MIYANHPVKCPGIAIRNRRKRHDARVLNDNIDAAVRLDRLSEQLLDLPRFTHISLDGGRFITLGSDFRYGLLCVRNTAGAPIVPDCV